MKYRKRLSRHASKRVFKRTAGIKAKNLTLMNSRTGKRV